MLSELEADLAIQRAEVAEELFPYLKRRMTLLTIVAARGKAK